MSGSGRKTLSLQNKEADAPGPRDAVEFAAVRAPAGLREVGALKVTAIVAAYNEEKTIGGVLDALVASAHVDEIIVVSDGSTDDTVAVARRYDVRTIALHQNRGKGNAMRVGVRHASHAVLFFVDADMLNLTEEHIEALVRPVVARECDMNVGVRHRGRVLDFVHLHLRMGPVISGIRVLRRAVWDSVPSVYKDRFKIELALNYFCNLAGFKGRNTVIRALGHVKKETKRGLRQGLAARFDMTREVVLLHFDLYFFEAWRWTLGDDALVPVQDYELFETELLD
jgi:polyisoprenyl-phosphate glycosyltransferase